jgi:hypothetical protein
LGIYETWVTFGWSTYGGVKKEEQPSIDRKGSFVVYHYYNNRRRKHAD